MSDNQTAHFLKWYPSQGPLKSANKHGRLAIGGSISTHSFDSNGTLDIEELFDQPTKKQLEDGATRYRCIYLSNNSYKTVINSGKLWLDVETVNGSGQSFQVGLGGKTGSEELLANETTAPTGITFHDTSATTPVPLDFTLNGQEKLAVWIKSTIAPKTVFHKAHVKVTISGQITL